MTTIAQNSSESRSTFRRPWTGGFGAVGDELELVLLNGEHFVSWPRVFLLGRAADSDNYNYVNN
jgi:hypothetical protein